MKKMESITIILIGTVIGIMGAGIAAWGTYKSGKESTQDTEKIISTGTNTNEVVNRLREENGQLNTELQILKDTSSLQLEKIQKLTIQNADLSIQLTKSTLLVSESITGGDGFCELEFATIPNNNLGKVFIKNHGKYPLHDFKARICELEEYDIFWKNNPGVPQSGTDIPLLPSEVKLPDINIDLGTILVGYRKELPIVIELGRYGKKSSFNIFMQGKNGHFCQLLRYYKVNDKWVKATRIMDLKDSMKKIILYENIDKAFPRSELNWD